MQRSGNNTDRDQDNNNGRVPDSRESAAGSSTQDNITGPRAGLRPLLPRPAHTLQSDQLPAPSGQAPQPYEPLIEFPEGTRSTPRGWSLSQHFNTQAAFGSVSQPTTHQSLNPPLSQPTAYQGLNPLVSRFATYTSSHPQLPRSSVQQPTAYQSPYPLGPLPATNQGPSSQAPQLARPSRSTLQPSQPAAHFRPLEMDPRHPQVPQLGGNQTSLPYLPLHNNLRSAYPPSLFSGGRLRGSTHYEAKLPDDTLIKFLVEAGADKERAAAVTSAKFSAVNDSLANTGLIPYFNETLRAYMFTDDDGDGDYPILTKAALRLRAYYNRMVYNAHAVNKPAPPQDHYNPLNLAFLETAPFTIFIEMFLDLFVQSFPNLQFIEVPKEWIKDLIISPHVCNMWKNDFGWEIEVKQSEPQGWMRIGKVGGWHAGQCENLFANVAADIANEPWRV